MKLFKWLGLLIGLPAAAIALFYFWASASTQDPQASSAVVNYSPGGINDGSISPDGGYTLVSYNIGYLSGLANNTATKPARAFLMRISGGRSQLLPPSIQTSSRFKKLTSAQRALTR